MALCPLSVHETNTEHFLVEIVSFKRNLPSCTPLSTFVTLQSSLFSRFQGDWCHLNRLTLCSSHCCSKCLGSRPRRPSLAETGSSLVWKRSSGRRAAARGAVLSSWGTPAPERPLSCGGWWRSALTARTRHTKALEHRTAPPPHPKVSIPGVNAAVQYIPLCTRPKSKAGPLKSPPHSCDFRFLWNRRKRK